MTTLEAPVLERVKCKGTDKHGRPCRTVFFEVERAHRAEVLSRIYLYCHDCKTVHVE